MKTLRITERILELQHMEDSELLELEIDKTALARILKYILQK